MGEKACHYNVDNIWIGFNNQQCCLVEHNRLRALFIKHIKIQACRAEQIEILEVLQMSKSLIGIAIILFAILLQLCSVGIGWLPLGIGIVGLIVTIIFCPKE